MVFQVEENIEAVINQLFDQLRPTTGEQFLAHFKPALLRRCLAGKIESRFAIRKIQCDDYPGVIHGLIGFIEAQLRQLGQSHCMAWLS